MTEKGQSVMDTREKTTKKTRDEIVEDGEVDDDKDSEDEDEDDEGDERVKAVEKNAQVVELEQITPDYIDDDEGEKDNALQVKRLLSFRFRI